MWLGTKRESTSFIFTKGCHSFLSSYVLSILAPGLIPFPPLHPFLWVLGGVEGTKKWKQDMKRKNDMNRNTEVLRKESKDHTMTRVLVYWYSPHQIPTLLCLSSQGPEEVGARLSHSREEKTQAR